MRIFILASFLLGSLLFESTLFEKLKVAGVKPDLLLIVVVFTALLQGRFHGAKLGFIFGLVEDLFLGRLLGLNALTKMLVGYLVGLSENKVFKDNVFIPIVGLFTATFVSNLIYIILAGLAGLGSDFGAYVWEVTLPTAIYNACIAPLFYGKFHRSATKGILKVSKY